MDTRLLLGEFAGRLERARPWRVLAVLVVAEWLGVLGLGLTVRHAGWTWYQGGDQLWFYTSGWLLAHGHTGYAGVGYLWPALLAPISLVAGKNVQSAYPAVVLIDVLVLFPAALITMYAIGKRIAGRLFGYWVTAVFVALPFVGIVYVNVGYHQRYVEQFLPQALGLTALSDFPALVVVLVSCYFCLRIVLDERPQTVHAIAAGLAAGAAIGIKPSAALFLGGPALALFDARRLRPALQFGASILPALVTMGLWKLRSSGHHIPLVAPYDALRVASIASLPLALNLHRIFTLDWTHLGDELANVRRYFAVGRLVEWAPVAGVFGLGRRSPGAAVLVGGWLGTFVVIKGTWDNASLETGSLLRILIPAAPAFALLVASLPFLWPGSARAAKPEPEPARPVARRTLVALVATVLVTAVVPFAAIAAGSTERGTSTHAISIGTANGPTPIDLGIGLAARTAGGKVILTWKPQSSPGGPLFYHVFRGPAAQPDIVCPGGGSGVQRCYIALDDLGATRSTTFVDKPGGGRWIYRVGLAANWADNTQFGDVYVLSSRVVAGG